MSAHRESAATALRLFPLPGSSGLCLSLYLLCAAFMDCHGSSRSCNHHIRFTEYSVKHIFEFSYASASDDPGAFRHTLHDIHDIHDIHERIKLFV